jgi:hypothetical protein
MQDTSTGLMHPIPTEFANLPERSLRQAMAGTIPESKQGMIFREGQKVRVDGVPFVIRKIIKKGLVLHGEPQPTP